MLATETQTEPRSRRHQTFDTKRLEVLGVAARVFSAVGYDRASMRRIAAEAGVSLAGIYHYVASKEALLETIQLHTFDSLLHGLEAELAGRVDPRRRLVAAVRNHLRHVRDHVHELRVCARELETLESTAGGAVHERRRAYIEAVHGLVAAVQGDAETGEHATGSPGSAAPVDAWLATANLFGMLNGLCHWPEPWRDAEPDGAWTADDLERLAEQQTTLFLDGHVACACGGGDAPGGVGATGGADARDDRGDDA